MLKNPTVHDLATTMDSSGSRTGQDWLSGFIGPLASTAGFGGIMSNRRFAGEESGDSIFSQLFERVLQGYALKLDDELDESGISLDIILDGIPDSVIIMSPGGTILRANQSFYLTFDYTHRELATKSIFDLLPEEYQGSFHTRLAEFFNQGEVPHAATEKDILAFRGIRGDGSIMSMHCLLSAIQFRGSLAVLALIRNLSFDQTLFLQLKETREHYIALSETITEAILRLDDRFDVIFANSGIKNTFGWEREEVMGKPFSMFFPKEVFDRHIDEFRKYFYVDDPDRKVLGLRRTFEFLGTTKHRGVAPMELSFGNSRDCQGRSLTCIIRDISQRKTIERKLRHLAYHDKLTGLGNRDLFNEDMATHFLAIEQDPTRRSGLLFLDLDGFKHINDTLGHDAGDGLLIEAASRIRVSLRDSDIAYRFGGDEFVVLLAGIKDLSDCTIVTSRILASISKPFELKSKDGGIRAVNVGVSIGVAVIPDHGRTVEDITKSADIAMYRSKEDGKNRYTLYDPLVSARATERWRLEQEMKDALSAGQFYLVYQPIVDRHGRIIGLEALSRWKRSDGTIVAPGTFIPIAEENGFIAALGSWALRRACYDLGRNQASVNTDIYISVNVSINQFELPGYVEELEHSVKQSGLSPSRIKLELTESAIMHNTRGMIERINDIKQRLPGIAIMVDDFGTGYSSLAYLSRLPIDALKVGRSFVRNLSEHQNEKVVNAIINLGHSLELDIIAEGIEDKEQADYFATRACCAMQGYYFLKPMALDAILSTIAKGPLPQE